MCVVSPPAELVLSATAEAPGRAREFLRQVHCATHQPDGSDRAQLLVTELVTNAVRHGLPPLRVRVECDQDSVVVRVGDASPARPVLREAALEDESGRGVALVDLLSDAWGIEPAEDGKHVWFRLRAAA